MHRFAVICLACFATTAAPGEDLAIINANLIDGTGAEARHTSINVLHNEIASLGEPASGDARILDVQGAFVIPGLIDSHVHLQSVPGAVFRKDDAQTRRSLMHHHLRGVRGQRRNHCARRRDCVGRNTGDSRPLGQWRRGPESHGARSDVP